MGNLNAKHNRAVWFDIPVVDLDRAITFYKAVLDIEVSKDSHEGHEFGVLAHDEGNGGCLVPNVGEVTPDRGILLYLNVDGRIQDAIDKVVGIGGKVVEDVHPIGPHGYRAIIIDTEGNRLALHSESDA